MLYFVCYLLPAPKMDKSNEITFYDRNDNIILKTHYQNVGSYVEIEDINEYFILAFIAAEDENFYSHAGISNTWAKTFDKNSQHRDFQQKSVNCYG